MTTRQVGYVAFVQTIYAGGYNGAKEGYNIPTGTDIFVSVS